MPSLCSVLSLAPWALHPSGLCQTPRVQLAWQNGPSSWLPSQDLVCTLSMFGLRNLFGLWDVCVSVWEEGEDIQGEILIIENKQNAHTRLCFTTYGWVGIFWLRHITVYMNSQSLRAVVPKHTRVMMTPLDLEIQDGSVWKNRYKGPPWTSYLALWGTFWELLSQRYTYFQ